MKNGVFTILVAEDEKSSSFLYTEELSDAGYRALAVENGYQVLGTLEDDVVDLLMTDIKMPDMDAFELLPQVRAQYRDLPIIVVSAFKAKEAEINALNLNISGFFTKPVDMVLLKIKIAQILGSTAVEL